MAKDLYCWRCNMIIPMLTEQEWEIMEAALLQALADIQAYRSARGASIDQALQQERGQSALRVYQELTGFNETSLNAIWHHRLSIYGPPCQTCGKPLRTPQASFCAACGAHAA